MSSKALKQSIEDEVKTILDSAFQISVVETQSVPHSSDGAITFPNFDAKSQGTKLINTCVLYIDIRRSTELNIAHRPKTVAKLYSAFVRAMTHCARHHNGHVRGIIGDRVMVIFDKKDAFVQAVHCAASMNSVSQFIINKHFKQNEVTCGIGIDCGNMLATKTGVRRRGVDQVSYQNLVWLGRPANVASKLTDIANKPEESIDAVLVRAAFQQQAGVGALSLLSSVSAAPPVWYDIWPHHFVQQLHSSPFGNHLIHNDPSFRSMYVTAQKLVIRPATGPILMTEEVWKGYKSALPLSKAVTQHYFTPINVQVSGYTGQVYSGDVFFSDLRD